MANASRNSLLGILLVASWGAVIWQQFRVKQQGIEIERLQSQSQELAKLRLDNDRLRKIEVDRAELERLRGLPSEVARLRAQLSSAQTIPRGPSNLAEPASSAPQTAAVSESADPQSSAAQLGGNMQQLMKGFLEQQTMGQLSRMKTRLNLTPDQEQAIREILARQIERSTEFSQKILAGKLTKQEAAQSAKEMGNPDDQIKALLTPEQQAAYQDYKTDDNAASGRLLANAEMLQMQNVLGLSQEQQDQVFNALYNHAQRRLAEQGSTLSPRPGDPTAWMQRDLAEKLKALEGILTPAQLQSYRQMQEAQLKLMKNLVPP